MASHSEFSPTLGYHETTEPSEEDDDALGEYHIDTPSDVDLDKTKQVYLKDTKRPKTLVAHSAEHDVIGAGKKHEEQ
jgi:hypothetical protein